jgi:hypothetical protein
MSLWAYAAVARREVLLAHTVTAAGSFDLIASDLRYRLDPAIRLTVVHRDPHKYFFLNDECGLNFLIVGYLATRPSRAHALLERLRTQFLQDPVTAGWAIAEELALQAAWSGMLYRLLSGRAESPRGMEEVLLNPDAEDGEEERPLSFSSVCCCIAWGAAIVLVLLAGMILLFVLL